MPPLADVWDRAQALLEQGGIVMPYILALSVLMWALILERLWFFWRVQPEALATARAAWEARAERRSRPARRLREHQVAALYAAGRRALPAIRALITVLPLLGLLGTVSGMIHTFEVITAFGGANRRGIAAGISEALVATLDGARHRPVRALFQRPPGGPRPPHPVGGRDPVARRLNRG